MCYNIHVIKALILTSALVLWISAPHESSISNHWLSVGGHELEEVYLLGSITLHYLLATAMSAAIPAALKTADISRFAIRAGQLEKARPAVAYWCESGISALI